MAIKCKNACDLHNLIDRTPFNCLKIDNEESAARSYKGLNTVHCKETRQLT